MGCLILYSYNIMFEVNGPMVMSHLFSRFFRTRVSKLHRSKNNIMFE